MDSYLDLSFSYGHPSLTYPHTASAPPISTAGMLHPKPLLQGSPRHTNTVTGTDTTSLTSAKTACIYTAIPLEMQLASLPLNLPTHLKAVAVSVQLEDKPTPRPSAPVDNHRNGWE